MIDSFTVELTSKEDIKNACYQENKTKFAQTIVIPAMEGKLMEDLWFLEILESYQQIQTSFKSR